MSSNGLFRFARALGLALVVAAAVPLEARAQTDGIFADFKTSMGDFTCRLEYGAAPKAVANFIGLATGQRPWLDPIRGGVRTSPFYEGIVFHRVIAGFIIQAGSPNGQGTDGPGYTFVDEFNAGLKHDGFGVLSMANAGPDSNGSQFFITVAPAPHLDGVHTIFGRLTGGSNVVYAISRVATNGSSRPLTNVVIQSVTIRRIGASAEAFDINAQGLAVVTNAPLQITRGTTNVILAFTNRVNADNRLYASTNLSVWMENKLGIVTEPASNTRSAGSLLPSLFFKMVQVQYPDTLYVPPRLFGRSLTFNFSGIGTMAAAFDGTGLGIYSGAFGDGIIIGYSWIQDAYRGRLSTSVLGGAPPMTLHLDFDSLTNGTFKGNAYLSTTNGTLTAPVTGTFTLP